MSNLDQSRVLAKPEVRRAVARCRALLRKALPAGSFAEREAAALAISNEAVRGVLEDDLQQMAAQFGQELVVNGVVYRRHEPGTVTYHSLCGGVVVTRYSYRQVGVHNGPTVVPLELVAGLIERATPAMAFNIAHGFAERDMRQHERALRTAHRQPPSRTALEDMANRIASAAVEEAPRVERRLRRSERVPDGACAIVVGLDRTAVAMLEPRPSEAPPKPEPKRRKPRVRKPPPPADINWRMAYVGTVSFVDVQGEAVQTRRYASPACDDPRELVAQLTADVRVALGREPTLTVGIVQDGAPEMWNRTREGLANLRDDGLLRAWHEGIDRYHLIERIAEALALVDDNPNNRERLLADWKERFDYDDATIETVERYLVRHFTHVAAHKQEQLWDHIRYIRNNKDRMRYATLRAKGLPVGSGATESAARTVIGQRAKGRGRRWRENHLRGVLTLRAHQQSERLACFWSHFSTRYVAHLEAA